MYIGARPRGSPKGACQRTGLASHVGGDTRTYIVWPLEGVLQIYLSKGFARPFKGIQNVFKKTFTKGLRKVFKTCEDAFKMLVKVVYEV